MIGMCAEAHKWLARNWCRRRPARSSFKLFFLDGLPQRFILYGSDG
jgi:hypothetical protein